MAEHPFHDPGAPTNEQWQAYFSGRLTEAERNAFERAIEADPLLRDAYEGSLLHGTLPAMGTMNSAGQSPDTGKQGPRNLAIFGAGALVVAAIAWFALRTDGGAPAEQAQDAVQLAPAVTVEQHKAFVQELAKAKAVGKEEQVQREREEIFIGQRLQRVPLAERESAPERMEPATSKLERKEREGGIQTLKPPGSLRRLLFLHDLKLVDPSELYPQSITVRLPSSVEARFADRQAQEQAGSEQRLLPYDAFMDGALGKYVSGDRQGCLEDLFFLMDQHPEDVNALFYAGLCCYELGLNARAESYLAKAEAHPVDSFNEEAQWYHALAVLKGQGQTAAAPLLQRVAIRGGFYAQRADNKLSEAAE